MSRPDRISMQLSTSEMTQVKFTDPQNKVMQMLIYLLIFSVYICPSVWLPVCCKGHMATPHLTAPFEILHYVTGLLHSDLYGSPRIQYLIIVAFIFYFVVLLFLLT